MVNIKINSLQHIGIPVTDINASIAFYEGLGFQDVMPSTFVLNGEPGRVSMMRHKDIILEIYQLPDGMLDEVRNRKNGHVDHVCFDVDDVDATFAELKSAGYTLADEAPVFLPTFWSRGCKFFNIIGPDGERLEFNQIR